MAKVSICIPTYNNFSCVQYLCTSIAQQTFSDYEVIITDDSTNAQIENYIKQNCIIERKKIKYFHNQVKLGHIFNWNAAIEKASGEYVKIMFSDDWFTFSDSLEKMVCLLDDNPDIDFAFCGSRQVKEDASYRDRYASDTYIANLTRDYRYLFLGNEIGAPSATLYRNKNVRFVEQSNWASDMFLYFNIFQLNSRFVYSKEPLISIMEHDGQYTNLFTERDIRKLNDYRLMYEMYSLQNFTPAKQYFISMILRYKQPFLYAKNCNYSKKEYNREKWQYIKKYIILNYLHAIQHKLLRH